MLESPEAGARREARHAAARDAPAQDASAPSSVPGVVPAAGRSTRMGQAKALLEVEGESFLKRAVDALAAGGCDPVWVVVAAGDRRLAEESVAAGARVLENPDPGEGPITSLRLALEQVDGAAAGLVYLPVDHPLVRPATVRELLVRALAAEAPLAVVTHRGERGHPAYFASQLFPELCDPELEGGARTVVHRHLAEAVLVEVDDPGVLVDVDEPSDLERLAAAERAPGAGAP